MRLVNLTPHDITVYDDNGNIILQIPKTGTEARVKTTVTTVGTVNGVPIVRTEYGDIEGLPDPEPDTIYITSTLVAQAAARAGRTDVIAPDTGPASAVRDERGNIIGVRRFQTF